MILFQSSDHQGKRLRALRNQVGLSQSRLARLANVGYHTVSRWENKAKFQRQSQALKNILSVLERLCRYQADLTRARGHGVLDAQRSLMSAATVRKLERRKTLERKRASRKRVRCGAKTRQGHSCRLRSEPGRRRCKFHGGDLRSISLEVRYMRKAPFRSVVFRAGVQRLRVYMLGSAKPS